MKITPDTLPPEAGKTASVNIDFSLPKTIIVGGRMPNFWVRAFPDAKLIKEYISPTIEERTHDPAGPYYALPFTPYREPDFFTGSMRFRLELLPGVKPGKITVSFSSNQQITLAGVQMSQGRGNFGRSAELVVTQQSGAPPPRGSTGTSKSTPSSTTAVTVPPFSPGLQQALVTLAVLMALAGIPWLYQLLFGRSASPVPATPAPPPPAPPSPPPQPPAPASAATRPPAPAPPASLAVSDVPATVPQALSAKPSRPPVVVGDLPRGVPIPQHLLRPDLVTGAPAIIYPDVPTRVPGPLADRLPPVRPRPPVDVELIVIPDSALPDGTVLADGVTKITLLVRLKPGAPLDAVIVGSGFSCSTFPQRILSTGNDSGACSVDWKWTSPDKPLVFHAVANVTMPDQPLLRCVPQPVEVKVRGADPKLLISCSHTELDGVGREAAELTATLELFGEPAGPEEKLEIKAVTAMLAGREWKHFTRIDDSPADAPRVQWTAPFLLARRDQPFADASLEVIGRWWAGPHFERASKPIPPLEAEVSIRVIGCVLHHEPEPPRFLPVPGMVLQAEASLSRGDGSPMMSPFTDGAVRAPEAGIECHVEDRTQGRVPPLAPHGCSIPPEMPESGPKKRLPTPDISDTGKIWTPRNPVGDPRDSLAAEAQRRGKDLLLLLLAEYAPKAGHDPVHKGPMTYTITLKDGMGDPVVGENACCVALEVLAMQTEGLKSMAQEHVPHTFQAELTTSSEHAPLLHDQDWQLYWEFAIVDEQGRPLASAGRFRTDSTLKSAIIKVSAITKLRLTVGHWRRGERIDTQDFSGSVIESRVFSEEEHTLSLVARRRWHELAAQHGHNHEAIEWARTPRADGGRNDSPWRDRVLYMALRLELRTKENHLLATSDMTYADESTKPSEVWKKNMFRYVLSKVRLHLQDVCGRPLPNRPWRFAPRVEDIKLRLPVLVDRVDSESYHLAASRFAMPPISEDSTKDGLFESLVAPGAESGTLFLLPSPGTVPDEPWCEIEVDIGGLPPVEDYEGMRARLENFGLCPGPQASGEQFVRALRKFQTLAGLPSEGNTDDAETRRRLEEAHRMANLPDGLPHL